MDNNIVGHKKQKELLQRLLKKETFLMLCFFRTRQGRKEKNSHEFRPDDF